LNRLKTVNIQWLSQTATYADYDPAGRLPGYTNFNNTTTGFSYDNAGRLTAIANRKQDTSVISSYTYTLDGNGNRQQITQSEPYTPAAGGSSVTYSYNTQKNRLLSAGSTSYTYDDEGQLATSSGSAFSFNYEHRLKTIAGTTQFYYDGSGNRLRAIRSGVETRYIYDAAGRLLAEADSGNVITKYYIYGSGLLAAVTPAGQTYCYHFNGVGSTIALTDQAQAVVNKYSYDAFGNIENQQEAITQPFKYVGQAGVMTEANGFYYMKARYYDPNVGRFVSEDPTGFGGGDVNIMAYVGNNPVNLVDPNGMLAFYWHFGITYVAARDNGYGVWNSLKLAWNVMREDRNSLDSSASASNTHAMRGIDPITGRYQSPESARMGTASIINRGGSAALHAAQDMPVHNFESMEKFGWNWSTAKHVLRDIFGGGTIGQAYQDTLNLTYRTGGCSK